MTIKSEATTRSDSAGPATAGTASSQDAGSASNRGRKKPTTRSRGASAAASSDRKPAAEPATRATGKSATAKADPKPSRTRAKGATTPRKKRSAAETEKIRVALHTRLVELCTEHDSMVAELTDLQRDRLTDSAGDDQADTGTKTFEREQEISLANGIRDRITQVERALERLDGGHYGYCERCGDPIPAERLAAFPSVTLCVACKQLEERR